MLLKSWCAGGTVKPEGDWHGEDSGRELLSFFRACCVIGGARMITCHHEGLRQPPVGQAIMKSEAEIDCDTNSTYHHLSFQRAGALLSAPLNASSPRKPRTATHVAYFDYRAGCRDDMGP